MLTLSCLLRYYSPLLIGTELREEACPRDLFLRKESPSRAKMAEKCGSPVGTYYCV